MHLALLSLVVGAAGCVDQGLTPVAGPPDACDPPSSRTTVIPDGSCAAAVEVALVDEPWNVAVNWTYGDPATQFSDTMPVVGYLEDTNGDGRYAAPDVPTVMMSIGSSTTFVGYVVALSGSDGAERWRAGPTSTEAAALTLADLDEDGRPELLTFDADGFDIALTGDGALFWRSEVAHQPTPAALGVGRRRSGEILVASDRFLLDGLTGQLLAELEETYDMFFESSFLVDLDLDGEPEWLARSAVWDLEGGLVWSESHDLQTFGRTLPVQADDDPEAEVVITRGGYATLREHNGRFRSSLIDLSENSVVSTPCLGDLDGDGVAEFVWPNADSIVAVGVDGELRWSYPWEPQYNLPACSLADLDADGHLEVLASNNTQFLILDGATGALRYEAPPRQAGGGYDPPVPADVDGDGHLDIVVTSSTVAPAITVYSHAGEGWAPGGVGWTSQEYSVTNSSPDGAIPARTAPGWLSYNMVRGRPASGPDPLADLVVTVEAPCAGGEVSLLVTNEGLAPVPAGVEVVLSVAGATVDSATLPALASGEGITGLVLSRGDAAGEVVVDPSATIEECDIENNRVSVSGR